MSELEVYDVDWAIVRVRGLMMGRSERYKLTIGSVYTKYGIVIVNSNGMKGDEYGSRLTFIWDGRLYVRGYNRVYSERYLVTLARRFAVDIAISKKED